MIRQIKRHAKALSVGGAAVATTLVAAAPAFAVGTADATVTAGFSGMSDNLVATVGAIAPYGIAIMVIFLGWRYGKKIFAMLSKG